MLRPRRIEMLDKTFERTADRLVRELSAKACRGATVEIWLFEGLAKRRAMRAELARHGITARVFCAYKPLVHYFLEEIDSKALVSAQIIYPRHPACAENRFLLEAYPLDALFPAAEIEFEKAAKAGPQQPENDTAA